MTMLTRALAIYRAFARFAEAVEADPLEDLHQRVARLERQASEQPHTPEHDAGSSPGVRP
jgi:hypothetical protein